MNTVTSYSWNLDAMQELEVGTITDRVHCHLDSSYDLLYAQERRGY
jgi:hypothetical protein